MGSLMSGWDSPVLDPKSVKYKRNRSLTKEEIEDFWKSKQKVEEEPLKSMSCPPHHHHSFSDQNLDGSEFHRSISSVKVKPASKIKEGDLMDFEIDTNLEKVNTNGWWTKSNWAFLNEPPVSETTSKTYVSQFHVAGDHKYV